MRMGNFTVTPSAGDIPTTNYEGGGYEEGLTGINVCEIEFAGFYDMANPPYAVLGLIPGVYTALRLYTSRTGGFFFSFPSWRLLSAPLVSNVENKAVMVSFKAKSDGPFFYPQG